MWAKPQSTKVVQSIKTIMISVYLHTMYASACEIVALNLIQNHSNAFRLNDEKHEPNHINTTHWHIYNYHNTKSMTLQQTKHGRFPLYKDTQLIKVVVNISNAFDRIIMWKSVSIWTKWTSRMDLRSISFIQHVNGRRHIADDEWISDEVNEWKCNMIKSRTSERIIAQMSRDMNFLKESLNCNILLHNR